MLFRSAGFGAAAPTAVMSPSGGRGYGGGSGGGYNAVAQTRYEPTAYQGGDVDGEGPEDEVPRSRRAGGPPSGRGREKKDKTGWIIISVVTVIVIVLAVFVVKTVFSGGGGTTGTVPTITGETLTQAQATLKASGYVIGTPDCPNGASSASSNTIPNGSILSQDPRSGATAVSGTKVSYCVSSGPVEYRLPTSAAVTAASATSVISALEAKQYSVTQKTETSSTVPSGNAIDIQNANGTSLVGQFEPVTTPLVVVVSGGPGTTTVPTDVVNEACSSADQELTNAGFNVNSQFNYVTNQSFAAQTVITTNPAPGSPVQKGASITITCSLGAGTTSTTPTASTSASASASASDTSGNGGFISGFTGGNN